MGIATSSILIIDRKDAGRVFLVGCLSDYYECFPVRTAEEAIELLSRRAFDLVITDIYDGQSFRG